MAKTIPNTKQPVADNVMQAAEPPQSPSQHAPTDKAGSGRGTVVETYTDDGKRIYRMLFLCDEYNIDKLDLDIIDMELFDAFNPEGDRDLLDDQLTRENGDDAAVHIRLVSYAEEDADGYDVCDEKQFSCPSPDHLIQTDDARLADLIRAAPLALLRSFDAQDALARWTYAVRHSHDPMTRDRAEVFLGTALPCKGRGPRGKATPDLPQFLQAYEDLCAYVRAIYKCASAQAQRHPTKAAARTPQAIEAGVEILRQHFPDVEVLRDFGVIPDEIVQDLMGPAANEVASAYVGKRHGLSPSRIIDLVGKARKHSVAAPS